MDNVTKAIVQLIDTERFYAELLMQMNRIVSNKVETAGVCIKDNIELHINPTFFDSLTVEERIAVLKHECQHILNDHISRSKILAPDVYDGKPKDIADNAINNAKHMIINLAADLAINPGIQSLPEGAAYPKAFDLKEHETLEWYAENLKNNDKLKNVNQYEDHDIWNESEGSKEELKAKINQSIKAAAQNTRAAGKMTADLEVLIDRLCYKPRDWRSDLRRFVARSSETYLESTRSKRNRRYGIAIPGSKKIDKLHIGVAIDTSGSVPDEAIHQFMAEIANIAKYAIVTVVEADSQVKNAYTFDPKKKYKVSGRGGTAYQPAFDYFTNETNVDGVIYFGDMDCFGEKLIKPKYQVMWAIVGGQEPPAKWGSKTKIEVRTNK